jgi:hypothetical protein
MFVSIRAWSWRLVALLLYILQRRRMLLAVWVWRRRSSRPLNGASKTKLTHIEWWFWRLLLIRSNSWSATIAVSD